MSFMSVFFFSEMHNKIKSSDTLALLPPNNKYPIVTSDNLHGLPESTRHFFYWIILTISVLAIIGNVLAIRSIIDRKTKFLQKSCIFTLALSDMFSVTIFCINILDMLSRPTVIWSLGEFMCHFVPYGQIYGTTLSSFLLMVIAMDRYQNVIQTFSKKRWDPKPPTCIFLIILLSIICGVTSYPMYTLYTYEPLWVLMLPLTNDTVYQFRTLCVAETKAAVGKYYIGLYLIIFLPIIIVFVWFYINIASLIWKHRKPVTSKFKKCENKEMEESTSSTKTTNIASINIDGKTQKKLKPKKNLQVERKIRTFRIVLVLKISFVLCRFPYWTYYTLRLINKITSNASWNLHLFLVALNIFNCVLNPLLYTFLNQTLMAFRIIKDFLWKICCCCCSSDEFEEFEKDNPFVKDDQIRPACGTVKARVHLDKNRFEEKNEKSIQKY